MKKSRKEETGSPKVGKFEHFINFFIRPTKKWRYREARILAIPNQFKNLNEKGPKNLFSRQKCLVILIQTLSTKDIVGNPVRTKSTIFE